MPDRSSRPGRPRRPYPPVARPAARPAVHRSGGAGPGATTTRVSAPRPRRVTGRAVVFGVVLLALAMSYVFPVRVYLAQQGEIAQLRADQQEQRARIDRMTAEAALWSTDEYIRIQARKRLYFGEPGEMLLLPVWQADPGAPPGGPGPDQPPVSPDPWWDSLWTSIRSANRPATGAGTG